MCVWIEHGNFRCKQNGALYDPSAISDVLEKKKEIFPKSLTVWKFKKFSLKNFRKIRAIENFCNFHTVQIEKNNSFFRGNLPLC